MDLQNSWNFAAQTTFESEKVSVLVSPTGHFPLRSLWPSASCGSAKFSAADSSPPCSSQGVPLAHSGPGQVSDVRAWNILVKYWSSII